jgi:hypothetical protein
MILFHCRLWPLRPAKFVPLFAIGLVITASNCLADQISFSETFPAGAGEDSYTVSWQFNTTSGNVQGSYTISDNTIPSSYTMPGPLTLPQDLIPIVPSVAFNPSTGITIFLDSDFQINGSAAARPYSSLGLALDWNMEGDTFTDSKFGSDSAVPEPSVAIGLYTTLAGLGLVFLRHRKAKA